MKPRFLLPTLLVAGAALWSPTVFAQDGVCDPNAAEAANDPDCADPTQGRVCDYADTAGDAATCGSADTCDSATTCAYADNCGDAETCDVANTCATADSAATCDVATYADNCDTAVTADVALSVGQCVTGVFSVGGGPSPDCGDLRYDGRLGINVDPVATLDVAGTAALRGSAGAIGLQVTGSGSVGIGTETPVEALDVVGVVVADGFIRTGAAPAPEPRQRTINPATDCRVGQSMVVTSDGRVSFETLQCATPLETGAVLTGFRCAGWGPADLTVVQRDGSFGVVGSWSASGDLLTGVEPAIVGAPAVERGGSFLLTLARTTNYAALRGCQLTYEVPTW